MSLTDKEILELNELCNALVEGNLSDTQGSRLSHSLRKTEEARRFYVRYMGLSASIFQYASEMQSETTEAVPEALSYWGLPRLWWALGSLAAAASLLLILWVSFRFKHDAQETATLESEPDLFVARLTGVKDCHWTGRANALKIGDHLRRGERLDMTAGVAEITFDSGAQVLLEGPARLDLNSAWDAVLRRGTLKANVPVEAIGFRVSNPAVQVIDLGTEFSMIADENSGATEVFVLKGAVEAGAYAAGGAERETVVLRESQSRRFALSGVSEVRDSEQKFKRLARKIAFDQPIKPTAYVHWTFDEPGGTTFRAEVLGMFGDSFEASLNAASQDDLTASRTEGRWQGAFRLDGHLFAQAPFPGISKGTARTVTFWVKMASDAQLPEAGPMVSWQSSGSNARIVQITVNRDPTQGVVGALRTELDRGFIVGMTPLRNEHWHHVAVGFVPGHRANAPMQVKQYVDGRLEGVTAKNVKKRRSALAKGVGEIDEMAEDIVSIGQRLGSPRESAQHFRGELDELFIVDRALIPAEIRRLMRENKLVQPALLVGSSSIIEPVERR